MFLKKPIFILLLIVIVALAFKIPAILETQSFWFDEVVSLEIAKKPILDSWQYLKWENNPPLHYWFLHYWVELFGVDEQAIRFSSLLFSTLSVIAIYFLGRLLHSRQAGLFCALLVGFSSFVLFISMDARMYSMLLFFSILSFYFYYKLLYQGKFKYWFLYFIFTLLAFYTHLTAIFIFIIQNIYFVYHYIYQQKNKRLKKWIFSQFLLVLFFLPWLVNFVTSRIGRLDSQAWYFNTQGSGFFLLQMPRAFLFSGDKYPIIELLALLLLATLFIYAFLRFKLSKKQANRLIVDLQFKPNTILALLIFTVPFLIGFILQIWVIKYYIVGGLGLFLIISIGFANLRISNKIKTLLALLIFLFLIPYNINIAQQHKHSWHQVASYVEQIEKPEDTILISAFVYELPFNYYYSGKQEVSAFIPKGLEQDVLLRAIKYNWYPTLDNKNIPDLTGMLQDTQRVVVVNPSKVELIHKANLVLDYFIENNWPLREKEEFGGFIQPTVFIFTNPSYTGQATPSGQ